MSRIYVNLTEPGWHYWPGAPDHRRYLSMSHRHLFEFRVSLTVHHDDRDVEFHDLIEVVRSAIEALSAGPRCDFGPRSCEAIARELCHFLVVEAELGGRQITVDVSEDGECGAVFHEEEL